MNTRKFFAILAGIPLVFLLLFLTWHIVGIGEENADASISLAAIAIAVTILAGAIALNSQEDSKVANTWTRMHEAFSLIDSHNPASEAAGWAMLPKVAKSIDLTNNHPFLTATAAIEQIRAFLHVKQKDPDYREMWSEEISETERILKAVNQMPFLMDRKTWREEWSKDNDQQPPPYVTRARQSGKLEEYLQALQGYK